MKKFYQFFLITSLSCIINLTFGQIQDQSIVTTRYLNEGIIQKIDNLHALDFMELSTESGSYRKAMPLEGFTPEDSINLQYKDVTFTINKIRFDPEKVGVVFPEVITTGIGDASQIDYTSFIPLLYEALYYQQRKISELEAKIMELELKKLQ